MTEYRRILLDGSAVQVVRHGDALVAADELVGGAQAGHEAALLEPKDRAEGAGEEDALDRGEGDEALREARLACKETVGRGRGENG